MNRWTLVGVCLLVAGCGDDGMGMMDGGPDGGDASMDMDTGPVPDAGPTEPPGFDWEDCSDGYRCATVALPLDYDDPGGPTIDVRILRVPSSRRDRIGIVMLNPGGPGAGLIEVAPMVIPMLQIALARFDIILMDPRGAGESTAVDCVDDAAMDGLRALPVAPAADDTAAWTMYETAYDAFGAGCAAGTGTDVLPHIRTDNMARDMDRIREMLGEDKLNYVGVSYGGVLGALYATLFPDRVRGFVLDSPALVDTTADAFAAAQNEAMGYENQSQRFFQLCGDDATCAFHGGEGEAAVGAAFDALVSSIGATPVDVGGRTAHALDLLSASAFELRDGNHEMLATVLADLESGDATSTLEAADGFWGRAADGYTSFFEADIAIRLADQRCPAGLDLDGTRTRMTEASTAAPRFGGLFAPVGGFCLGWPAETPGVPAVSAPTAPPLLLLGSANDPATPLARAEALQDELGNGSYLVEYRGEGHGYITRSACILGVAVAFMNDPTTAPTTTVCTE